MKRLAIITTHPIQYNAPWFRLLAERGVIHPKVFYTWSQVEKEEKFDPGFGKVIEWDIPLLEGYEYTFVHNVAKNPGSKSYRGIDNPSLIKEVQDWKPDAVLIFGWKFKSHWRALKYFFRKVPVLFRGDSTLVNDQGGWNGRFRKIVLKKVYRKINYALYVGTENRKYFRRSGLSEDKLVFAPHAIDNTRFQDLANIEKGRELRSSLSIPQNSAVFLFAGKFEPVKNPLLLRSAADGLNDDNIHFLFVGNGPLEEELKKDASQRIHFMNFQNQSLIPAVYQMADVFVLPSVSETWGLAVNEAMAAGKPVLVSDRCGCAADLVEEGVTGYTFRSNEVNDLRAKILLMASDKNQLQQMGINAVNQIKNWSFVRIAEAIERTLTKEVV